MSQISQLFLDEQFAGIPWKDGGRTREGGMDCAGLALAWLQHNQWLPPGSALATPPQERRDRLEEILEKHLRRGPMERGDIVFFRHVRTRQLCHVAIFLGNNRYLTAGRSSSSRIDNGLTLLTRASLQLAGAIPAKDAEAALLLIQQMGLPGVVWLIIASVVLAAASAFLMPKPKLGSYRNQAGSYGFTEFMQTQRSSTLPLPDVFGAVTVAGNAPYTSIADKSQTITDSTQQKANRIIILAGGPIAAMEYLSNTVKINGLPYAHTYWHANGIDADPEQTKAEAVDGTIAIGGNTNYNRPSLTFYDGAYGIEVPVDIRASYDRNFPVYGLSGVSYLVLRMIDSAKFKECNVTATIKGRLVRSFTSAGLTTTTIAAESLGGADGTKVRFKLANWDLVSVASVSVNGSAYTALAADNQAGDVYHVNLTKGYIEFITAPAAGAAITVAYTYYRRAWTQNPASALIYLLTEPLRGLNLTADQIDWPAAVALRDFCDEQIVWNGVLQPRYTCNYSLDYRKPIQEHLRAVLDSCYAYLFKSGGKFTMLARAAATSVFSFTESNILKDSFSSELLERSRRPNRVHVFYHSNDTYNAETEVVRDDPLDQAARAGYAGEDGVIEDTLHMLAVDSQHQAERLGEQILREYVNARWVCEFKTTVLGIALQPGDVIDVTHSSQPAWSAKLFRIEDVSLEPDGRIQLRCTEYFAGAYLLPTPDAPEALPLAPLNLRHATDGYLAYYTTGQDLTLTWNMASERRGHFWTLWGNPTTVLPYIVLEFRTTGGVLKETVTLAEGVETYTYTNAALVAAFGSETDVAVRAYARYSATEESDTYEELTILKR